MATRYVDCTVSAGVGTNTGTGTALDPWTNVASAYTAATAGDTILLKTTKSAPFMVTANILDTKGVIFEPWGSDKIYIDGTNMSGFYVFRLEHANSAARKCDISKTKASTYAFRINANIADGAMTDNYVHDCAGDALLTAAGITSTVILRRNHFTRCNIGHRIDALGVGGQVHIYDTRDENHVLYSRSDGANTVVKTFRLLSGGHTNVNWLTQNGASTEHNNPILIGGGKSAARDVHLNMGTGVAAIKGGVVTYPVLDSTPYNLGFTNSGGGSNTLDSLVKGPAGESAKIFNKPRRGGMVCFIRDDIEAYVTGGVFPGELSSWLDALEARSLRGTYANTTREGDNPNAISPAQWLEIKSVIDRGHDLATHGRTGCHMRHGGGNGLAAQYTGAATTVRFVIAENRLQTFHNGSATPTLNYDLMQSGMTISGIVGLLNANSYTATIATLGTSPADAVPARCLADVDIANIKTASNNLIIDADRLVDWEVTGAADDIFNNTGYRPKTHVWSAGSANSTIAAKVLSRAGFYGARLGSTVVANITDVIYKFPLEESGYSSAEMFGLHTNFLNQSTDAILTRSVQALCHWAMWHGVPLVIYAHEYAEFSLAKWGVLFDAVKSTGIAIGTYTEVAKWAKDTAATRPTLEQQYINDDAWDPALNKNSVYFDWAYGAGGAGGSGLKYQVTPNLSIPL